MRNIKPLAILCECTARFVSDLVGNPENRFSHNEAQILEEVKWDKLSLMKDQNHNENMPLQYNAIFHGCKNVNFQMKIFNIFLIFAQNIDCGYTIEPPQ